MSTNEPTYTIRGLTLGHLDAIASACDLAFRISIGQMGKAADQIQGTGGYDEERALDHLARKLWASAWTAIQESTDDLTAPQQEALYKGISHYLSARGLRWLLEDLGSVALTGHVHASLGVGSKELSDLDNLALDLHYVTRHYAAWTRAEQDGRALPGSAEDRDLRKASQRENPSWLGGLGGVTYDEPMKFAPTPPFPTISAEK